MTVGGVESNDFLDGAANEPQHDAEAEAEMNTSMELVHDDQWRVGANEMYGIVDLVQS